MFLPKALNHYVPGTVPKYLLLLTYKKPVYFAYSKHNKGTISLIFGETDKPVFHLKTKNLTFYNREPTKPNQYYAVAFYLEYCKNSEQWLEHILTKLFKVWKGPETINSQAF